jgi:hypothetical protein
VKHPVLIYLRRYTTIKPQRTNTHHTTGGTDMTTQEIFETLAENESKLFYATCRDPKNEELKAAHIAARQALESFARATGCHN